MDQIERRSPWSAPTGSRMDSSQSRLDSAGRARSQRLGISAPGATADARSGDERPTAGARSVAQDLRPTATQPRRKPDRSRVPASSGLEGRSGAGVSAL